MPPAYNRTIPLAVSCEEAFAAIATLDGLRGWWERFLTSLETLVERGEGMPYGHAAAI